MTENCIEKPMKFKRLVLPLKVAGLSAMLFFSISATAQVPGGGMPGRGAGAQQATGRFYGKVVDASNKGVEAASVALVQERVDSVTKQKKEIIVGGMLTAANGD